MAMSALPKLSPARQKRRWQRGPYALWRRPGSYPFLRDWGDLHIIALYCGVTPQAVSLWKRIPVHHLHTVASLIGVPAGLLRPDFIQPRIAAGEPVSLTERLHAWRVRNGARDRIMAAQNDPSTYFAELSGRKCIGVCEPDIVRAHIEAGEAMSLVERLHAWRRRDHAIGLLLSFPTEFSGFFAGSPTA